MGVRLLMSQPRVVLHYRSEKHCTALERLFLYESQCVIPCKFGKCHVLCVSYITVCSITVCHSVHHSVLHHLIFWIHRPVFTFHFRSYYRVWSQPQWPLHPPCDWPVPTTGAIRGGHRTHPTHIPACHKGLPVGQHLVAVLRVSCLSQVYFYHCKHIADCTGTTLWVTQGI